MVSFGSFGVIIVQVVAFRVVTPCSLVGRFLHFIAINFLHFLGWRVQELVWWSHPSERVKKYACFRPVEKMDSKAALGPEHLSRVGSRILRNEDSLQGHNNFQQKNVWWPSKGSSYLIFLTVPLRMQFWNPGKGWFFFFLLLFFIADKELMCPLKGASLPPPLGNMTIILWNFPVC
jgi:hypothetical protein